MYPACILHLRYVPLRIHLGYMYPIMYLGSVSHVSSKYPRTTADTCIPHVSCMYPACILHVSGMYPACILEPLQIHVPRMYLSCCPHASRMYPACIPHVSFMYRMSLWIHIRIHQDTCILDSSSRYIKIHRDTKSRYMYLRRVMTTLRDTIRIHHDTCILDASSEPRWIHTRYARDTLQIHSGYVSWARSFYLPCCPRSSRRSASSSLESLVTCGARCEGRAAAFDFPFVCLAFFNAFV